MRALLVAALLAGLAFAGDAAPDPDAPVATLAGQPISKAQLVGWWFERYPQDYARVLDEQIDERLARRAAAQVGLRVPPAVLARAIDREVEARRKLVQEVYGPSGRLEAWVREGYGLDLDAWKREILSPRLERVLLTQRVVRLFTHERLRVHARVIVTFQAAKAERLAAKLRAGADFSLVALKESEDATRKVGGTLPPISKGDLADFPIVERRLLAAPAGSLLGPWRVQVDGRPQWQLYKVVKRDTPWRLTGAALLERLETDLRTRPVTRAELLRWRRHVRLREGVRYLRPDGRPWRR